MKAALVALLLTLATAAHAGLSLVATVQYCGKDRVWHETGYVQTTPLSPTNRQFYRAYLGPTGLPAPAGYEYLVLATLCGPTPRTVTNLVQAPVVYLQTNSTRLYFRPTVRLK